MGCGCYESAGRDIHIKPILPDIVWLPPYCTLAWIAGCRRVVVSVPWPEAPNYSERQALFVKNGIYFRMWPVCLIR
jgi:hypothetical protein